MSTNINLANLANSIRFLAIDMVEKANSGHPGMPMGMADTVTVLATKFLRFMPDIPTWPNRDRLVLSAGHGSALLYAMNHLLGYDISLDAIENFRQGGHHTDGHPEVAVEKGIETTTGPLGQGLATAVGLAIAERKANNLLGDNIISHKTYVIAGDGCLMEGISQEAISLAGHLKLNNLIVLFDDNGITIDGSTALATSEDQLARFTAVNWHVIKIDGHDYNQIEFALNQAQSSDKPVLIACKTTIGYGSPKKADSASAHGSPLGSDEVLDTRSALGWSYDPFEVPQQLYDIWQQVGKKRNQQEYDQWQNSLKSLKKERNDLLDLLFNDDITKTDHITQQIADYLSQIQAEQQSIATRKASGNVIDNINSPILIGGSADLAGSNNTKGKLSKPITAVDFSGNYIHYGIREHAMGAIMNGLSLYGFIPYGGTFLVFSDYARPSIRLSALMSLGVIYVMTHDSIGLGEDGPTHQPIEHLASLRAMPDINVWRPADSYETAVAWQHSLLNHTTPSILALSRQNLPYLQCDRSLGDIKRGGYIVYQENSAMVKPDLVIVATGSEVALAIEVAKQLNINTQVASLPCLEVFSQQNQQYQEKILGSSATKRVFIEAGSSQSWYQYLGTNPDSLVIGIDKFGASAPANVLFAKYGFSVESIISKITQ
jgi:transketolase